MNVDVTPPSAAEADETKKVAVVGDGKSIALPLIYALSLKAGLFAKPKAEPVTQEQEDRVISQASAKLQRRCARNLKNKANGGY
jgi:hypothetical protein